MRRFLLGAAACLAVSPTYAQTACPVAATGQCSAAIGSTPVQLTNTNTRRYQRIVNASASATLWCTRDPAVTPSVGGLGTFPIRAGAAEEYPIANSAYVPPMPTVCVSDTAATPVAVEIN
jgi:hypothetical protein